MQDEIENMRQLEIPKCKKKMCLPIVLGPLDGAKNVIFVK